MRVSETARATGGFDLGGNGDASGPYDAAMILSAPKSSDRHAMIKKRAEYQKGRMTVLDVIMTRGRACFCRRPRT